MKRFLTTLFLITGYFATAQNVYIPGSDFKNQLIDDTTINTNGDREIQVTEALAVVDLTVKRFFTGSNMDISYTAPTDITGIEAFTNLQRLTIDDAHYGGAPNINLSTLSQLRYFNCPSQVLTNLNLTGCTSLDSLILSGYTPFDQSGGGRNGALQSLDLTSCANLSYFSALAYPNLDTIQLQNCINLKTLHLESIGWFAEDSIDLTDLTKLEDIRLWDGLTAAVDFSLLTKLRKLSLVLAPNISSLHLENCINLEELQLSGIQNYAGQENLDLSQCSKLKMLNLAYLPLESLNLKNGSSLIFSPGNIIREVPNLHYVCADEFEVDSIRSLFQSGGVFAGLNINSYCNFVSGGSYNTIKGKARIDLNNNGCDSTERSISNLGVRVRDTSGNTAVIFTNESGDYSFYPQKGNFILTSYFPYPFFTINPATANVSFDTANSLVHSTDFCIQPAGLHNDLEISFLPAWPPARPGFNAAYTLLYKNRGTTTLSGNVSVNFDNSKMNFTSASNLVTTQNTGELIWNYNNLQPFEYKSINITFTLLPPPVNNNGDTINYLATINPSTNDETAFDNTFILPQRVSGSFDPNDKQCLEGSKLDISKIGDYLHYQIRFQNEGTDTAFNIVVVDTLSDKLDWNTFEFIGSSHSCDPVLKNNKAEFFFENINLPYKAIDEPGSNGWVAFKIKPKPSVVIGDSLNNSAAIYFDFNLPVITNMATTIVTSSSTPVPVKLEYFSANKKENTNQLNWKASCTYGNAGFIIERSEDGINFKAIGNINATAVRCQLPFNFTDNNPVTGKNYYRLKITDADGKSFYSKTLVVGNNKADLEITAIANNTVYLSSNKQQTIIMKVIAADGRIIYSGNKTINAGNSHINLSVKEASGIYTLIIYTMDGNAVIRKYVK